MSTDFDEEDRSSIIYPKAFYTWKSEIRYTGWCLIGLLQGVNYRLAAAFFIIIYSVDRLANKVCITFCKKKCGVAK